MGQTLTHGVYLPDEGERNCYSGLAANWQILDNSVGTIAAHTAALAGKAPLVHTHVKSDITDFPAYGNTAGTICEGNDSRLSDARTPVAHTHTKSDVTDLFNSANTWTGDNTFNNIKSKGLNLTNNGRIYTEVPSLTKGTLPSSTYYYSIQNDYAPDSSSASNRINQKRCYVETNGTNAIEWNLTAWGTTNIAVLRLSITADGTNKTYLLDANTIPGTDSTYNLGDSSNKWKTLNGINPGALSLPDYSKSMNVDTTGWSTSAGRINYTPTVNGWLQIAIPNDIDNNNEKSNFITIMDTDIPNVGFNNPSGISAGNTNDYRIQITFPVVANKTYYIYIKSYSGNILAVKYIAALGHI